MLLNGLLLLQLALCATVASGEGSGLKRRLQFTSATGEVSGYGGYGWTTGSPGYGGYSGTVTGSPGYGGYSGSWVYCEEMYCYSNVFDAVTGEIDWDKTYETDPTCAKYDEGCPCNEQWEVECDSWGYKYCEQKSIGCFDPHDVTCQDYEVKCKDSWSTYCWDPSWGACPLYCNSTETYCYSYSYDKAGMMNYSDYHEYCAPADTGCTCNAQWEHKCTDQWGYSWCQAKTQPCPITCGTDEQDCWMTPYGADGFPDWNASYNQTCHPIDQPCPCHPVHEETCSDNWGNWCQSKVYGSCPVSCAAGEMTCWVTPYDGSGNPIWDAIWNETCAPEADGCPCNSQWEKQCTSYGYKFCELITNSCPVDCGEVETCYHYMSGNQSCATTSGCVCEADEITCSNPDTGKSECYPTDWYPSGCPVFCKMSEMYCSNVTFDATGMMQWTDYCVDGDSNNWMCPVHCDTMTSKKCGTPGSYDEHCVAISESCPLSCTSEQQYCWVDEYDATGMWLSSSETCVAVGQDCPCGSNAVQCEDPFFGGYKYCTAEFWGCPLYCDPITEKTCYPVAFTEDGVQDWNAPIKESCQNITQPCGCGANAKMCRWTDEWGYENEICYPTSVACPVTCKEDEQRCYITDYEANGAPGVYRETCVKADQVCPCGSHSQQCHDPYWDYHYCYPLVDWWSNSTMRCPVYCTEDEDYCYSPSYNANGEWLSTVETCVPKGTKCKCTGQNSFSCDFNEWGYTWTECLPIEGGYCPPTCADGEVSCPIVDDYKPDGSWLGWADPSTKCAANWDSCPCGTEAKSCPGATAMRCIFKDEECPVVCTEKQKKCWITDFTQTEEYISDREICVAEDETCPCGQNTQRCPGSDTCLLPSEASLVCPCDASEKQCNVVDYTSSGKQSNISVQCINKGAKCPCGSNSLTCPDPNDAEENICRPKYSGTVLNSCPKACTPAQETAGNRTCIQTHLTGEGAFRSESISCVKPTNCIAGENMQKCPSGTHIPAWKQCKDLYGTGGSNSSAIGSGKKQKSQVILVLDSVADGAIGMVEDARVVVNGEVHLPEGLKTSITFKQNKGTSVQSRRLSRRATTATTGAVVTLEIQNEGPAAVAPVDVAQELQKQVKSSSAGVMKALTRLGNVNTKAGVRLASEQKTITTRAEVANQQRKAALGISDPSTTPSGGQGGSSSTTGAGGDGSSTAPTTSTQEQVSSTVGLSLAMPSCFLNLVVAAVLALRPAL